MLVWGGCLAVLSVVLGRVRLGNAFGMGFGGHDGDEWIRDEVEGISA